MIHTRTAMYETNSSSTHALHIADDDGVRIQPPSAVTIATNEFGWEFETYHDFETKLSYVHQCLTYSDTWEDYDRRKDALVEFLHNHGVAGVTLPPANRDTEYVSSGFDGYVDHGDEYLDGDILPLLEKPERLAQFLFDDRSYLETGNDNDYPPDYFGSGFCGADGWEGEDDD